MSYQINLNPAALDDLRQLLAHLRPRVARLLDTLADDPQPSHSKQLRAPISHLRPLPKEGWRIIYEVDESDEVIRVVRIKRKQGPETYDDLM